MRWLARRLHRVAEWCSPTSPAPPPIISPEDSALARVRVLCLEFEPREGSGEWKRHEVYARLIKELPQRRKRDLAYLIEVAIQEWT